MSNLQELINGSDLRGRALRTEAGEANLTPVEVQQLAIGIVKWLQLDLLGRRDLKIAIGHDSRLTADSLKNAMIETFVSQGVTVIDVGLATTPAMFMATQFAEYQCDLGIMLTASHLPYYFNGIKLFTKKGGAEHEDVERIVELALEQQSTDQIIPLGTVEKRDLIPLYAADLVTKIRQGIGSEAEKPLAGFHIIVDAGNGAGGYFASQVLEVLGADTTGSQFLDPDGNFPNHIPNPDNPAAMASIQQAVLQHQADLGVIFDTDVDRSAIVDRAGNGINRNSLIAVLAKIVLEEHPGSTIVTNSPTSTHLKHFIESLGGKQYRYISGYRNVINQGIKLNQEGTQVELAIETSGHAAFKENYFLDDGAYVIAKILMLLPKLQKQQKTITDLMADLAQPAEAQEVRFKITTANYQETGRQVIHELEKFVQETPGFEIDPENQEGLRVTVSEDYGSGWFLLRMSLHEPLLVLQVENDVLTKNHAVFKKLATFFQHYETLNQTALAEIIS
ncbi:phosphomannomutase/phosphoglucomutase [Vagococcus salmoninarum]|uniref:phosphomannomutase/phosphoglucomutase n=1 Tax=Vagococcus salmoninarum TaxID=2739 RepID=UPI003F9B518B